MFSVMSRVFIVCCAVALAACERRIILPTESTPPAPTVTGMTIAGSASLRTEQSELFTADVRLSNGTTGSLPLPTWSSSDESVASVTELGIVTANRQGTATILASAQGVVAQTPLQVWQNYHGTWIGTFTVRKCAASGAFIAQGFCSTFSLGTLLPFVLTLMQDQGTAAGTLTLSNLSGAIQGGIFSNRHFVGHGSQSALIDGIEFSSKIGTFDVLADSAAEGYLVTEITSPAVAGSGYVEAGVASLTRVSYTAQVAAPAGR